MVSTELVNVTPHCVLLVDQFNSIVSVAIYEPERSNKNRIRYWIKSFYNKVLLYTHIARQVVQVFALSRILDQLTLFVRPFDVTIGQVDWQKYPKNQQSIRKQQPKPLELESKTCHAFPGKRVRL